MTREDSWQVAHDAAVAAGEAGYLDPDTGLFVLTAQYLRDRGHCCGNGCRHCPYEDRASGPADGASASEPGGDGARAPASGGAAPRRHDQT